MTVKYIRSGGAPMIECQECNEVFPNMITWRHLKKCCGLTTKEYKAKHGEKSLVSPEYAKRLSEQSKEVQNRPEVKAATSAASKRNWSDPKFKEQMSATQKEAQNRPKTKE